MKAKTLALVFFLLPALAGEGLPGQTLILPFPGLEGEAVFQVAPFRPLLLPREAEGVAVLVLEVPQDTPPGVYRVCARAREVVCQEVEVPEVRRLETSLRADGLGGVVVVLENRGNRPETVRLSPEGESDLGFAPLQVTLAPGERKTLRLALGPGVLLLRVEGGGRVERHRLEVKAPGGKPPPYRLKGSLEGSFPLGLWGSLEGSLSRGSALALRLQGLPSPGVFGRFVLGGAFAEGAFGSQGLGEAALGYEEKAFALRLAYPLALRGEWRTKDGVWFLEGGENRVALGYGGAGFSFRASWAGSPAFRLERSGDGWAYLAYEGTLRAGGGLPLPQGAFLQGEAALYPERSLALALGGPGYRLEGRVSERGWGASATLAFPLGGFGAWGSLALGEASGLVLGLRGQEGGLSWSVEGGFRGGPVAQARLAYGEGPYALEGALGYGTGGFRGEVRGRYAFALPVPEGLTLALGGYEQAPVEGLVRLEGKPLAGARVVGRHGLAQTDGEGRFRLFLDREGEVLRVEPPEGALALPKEVPARPGGFLAVDLEGAGLVRLRCEGEGGLGAYLLGEAGSLYLPCPGQGVVVPGVYRVVPQGREGFRAEGSPEAVRVEALKEAEVLLRFGPLPLAPARGVSGGPSPRAWGLRPPRNRR
ncbi:hypothetical protein GCM10007092_15250 [Thermus composti]|nr:hypothetical protein GCM10007092_15250 [Thermus composti]